MIPEKFTEKTHGSSAFPTETLPCSPKFLHFWAIFPPDVPHVAAEEAAPPRPASPTPGWCSSGRGKKRIGYGMAWDRDIIG